MLKVTFDFFGKLTTVDLCENGAHVAVTKENRAEYVDAYVDYVFNRSCIVPYAAFERGFKQVCDGYALNFLRPAELQVSCRTSIAQIENVTSACTMAVVTAAVPTAITLVSVCW